VTLILRTLVQTRKNNCRRTMVGNSFRKKVSGDDATKDTVIVYRVRSVVLHHLLLPPNAWVSRATAKQPTAWARSAELPALCWK
jgi:hypothetical protein